MTVFRCKVVLSEKKFIEILRPYRIEQLVHRLVYGVIRRLCFQKFSVKICGGGIRAYFKSELGGAVLHCLLRNAYPLSEPFLHYIRKLVAYLFYLLRGYEPVVADELQKPVHLAENDASCLLGELTADIVLSEHIALYLRSVLVERPVFYARLEIVVVSSPETKLFLYASGDHRFVVRRRIEFKL